MVKRFRTVLLMLLALLWAPVTSHCMFERLDGFDFLSCCTHEEETAEPAHHEEEDCSTDACAVVEEGSYKLQDHDDLLASVTEVSYQARPKRTDTMVGGARPPPDIAVGWQFSHRAAPLIRAPSSLL